MSGVKYIFDTNVIINLSKDNNYLDQFLNSNDKVNISVITYIECLGFDFLNTQEENLIKLLFEGFRVINLEKTIIQKTVDLRKVYKIKLPDAIIAATAIVNNWPLVTANVKDFEKIQGLKLVNPSNIQVK